MKKKLQRSLKGEKEEDDPRKLSSEKRRNDWYTNNVLTGKQMRSQER